MANSISDPKFNLRCHHCAGPLSKRMETSEWTVAPLVRDSFSMIGSAVGGTTSAFYGFNYVMPKVRRWVKGPMWVHFLIGAPPVIVFSSACAGLAGGAIPAVAQLASSSYHAAFSSSTLPPSSQKDEMHESRTSSSFEMADASGKPDEETTLTARLKMQFSHVNSSNRGAAPPSMMVSSSCFPSSSAISQEKLFEIFLSE